MPIENQTFDQQNSIDQNPEIIEQIDTLTELSNFFEGEGFDTQDFKDIYPLLETNQQNFIESSFQQLKEYPDELIVAVENTGGLPYDEQSYQEFKEEVEKIITRLGLIKSEWSDNIIDNSINQQDIKNEEIAEKNEEIVEINEEKNTTKEEVNTTKEEISKIEDTKIDIKKNQEKELIEFGESIKTKYGKVNIDGSSVDELYVKLKEANKGGEDFNIHIEFIKKYGADLLKHIAKTGTQEEFQDFKLKLEKAQVDFDFKIDGLSKIKYNREKVIEKEKKIPRVEEDAIKHGIDRSQGHIGKMEGDIYIYGDQKIDFSEKPPVKYITSGEFELKSATLDFKVDKKIRKEIFILEKTIPKTEEKIGSIKNKINKSDEFMKNIDSQLYFEEQTLDYLYLQYTQENNNPLKSQIINAIDKCDNDGENLLAIGKLKNLLQQDTNNKKIISNTELVETEKLLSKQESTLKVLKLKLSMQQEQFKEKVLEQDEKTRETLEFIDRIGLGILPQSIFNQLITELQMGSMKVDGINLDPQKIDLANGRFGESDNESDGTKWKENLVQFFNKMISGNTGEPLDLKQFIGTMAGRVDPTYFKEDLEKYGVINDLGEPLLSKIRSNISVANNLEEEKETTKK